MSITKPTGPIEFPQTLWTEVIEPAQGNSETSRAALRRLCEIYYDAIRAFFRVKCAQRGGHDPGRPNELANGFVERLLEKNRLTGIQRRNRPRFRHYLTRALTNYYISVLRGEEAAIRGGGRPPDSLEHLAEAAGFEPADGPISDVPEVDQRFALAQHRAAVTRLDKKHSQDAQPRRYELLRPYLRRETEPDTLAQIATSLGERRNTIQVALIRLREEYHDAFRAQVAETVDQRGPDLNEEIRYLSGLVLLALEADSGED